MCRNIKVLRRDDGEPTEEELRDAALQYIRKLSGYRKPSRVNEAAFEQAIDEVTAATRRMFDDLVVRPAARAPESAAEASTAQAQPSGP